MTQTLRDPARTTISTLRTPASTPRVLLTVKDPDPEVTNAMKSFENLEIDEIKKQYEEKRNPNTDKATRWAMNTLRHFCEVKKVDLGKFPSFSAERRSDIFSRVTLLMCAARKGKFLQCISLDFH
ncbi:MAG TPA: hypothetical protein V6C97_13670 [Oculatellaceae cyanobacterium]